MNLIQSPFFLCKGQIEMSVSTKKCFKTVLSGSVWTICGLIVVYQSILCVEKYIENPKGIFISVIIRINTGIKIFPQSANKIQTLANPSWYEALHRNYSCI